MCSMWILSSTQQPPDRNPLKCKKSDEMLIICLMKSFIAAGHIQYTRLVITQAASSITRQPRATLPHHRHRRMETPTAIPTLCLLMTLFWELLSRADHLKRFPLWVKCFIFLVSSHFNEVARRILWNFLVKRLSLLIFLAYFSLGVFKARRIW